SLQAEPGSPLSASAAADSSRYHRLTPISPISPDDNNDEANDAATDVAVVGGDSTIEHEQLDRQLSSSGGGVDSSDVAHPEYRALPPSLAERSTVLADKEVSFYNRTDAVATAAPAKCNADELASELSTRARDLLDATAYAEQNEAANNDNNKSLDSRSANADASASFDYDSLRRDLASIQARLANHGYRLPLRQHQQPLLQLDLQQQLQHLNWGESTQPRRLKWDYGADLGGRRPVSAALAPPPRTTTAGPGSGFLSSPSPEYEGARNLAAAGRTSAGWMKLGDAEPDSARWEEDAVAAAAAPDSARSQDTSADTRESTHPGSDDARPPGFPAEAFGSRRSPRGKSATGAASATTARAKSLLYARSPRDPPPPEGLQAAWERFHRQGRRSELRRLRRVLADPVQALLLDVPDRAVDWPPQDSAVAGFDVDDDSEVEVGSCGGGGSGVDATTAELQAALLRQRARLLEAVAAERRRRERVEILRRLIQQRRLAQSVVAMERTDSEDDREDTTVIDDALSTDRTDATQSLDEMTLPHCAARAAAAIDKTVAKDAVAKAKAIDGVSYKLNGSRSQAKKETASNGSSKVKKVSVAKDANLASTVADDNAVAAKPLSWFLPLSNSADAAENSAACRRQQRAAVLAARSRSRRDRLQSAAAARQAVADAELRLPTPPLTQPQPPPRTGSGRAHTSSVSATVAARLERERREAVKRTNRLRKQIYGERLLRSVLSRAAEH
ncbi:hypothetical protein BOX15_Mlig001999g4, partial [Macrostomum lignano]